MGKAKRESKRQMREQIKKARRAGDHEGAAKLKPSRKFVRGPVELTIEDIKRWPTDPGVVAAMGFQQSRIDAVVAMSVAIQPFLRDGRSTFSATLAWNEYLVETTDINEFASRVVGLGNPETRNSSMEFLIELDPLVYAVGESLRLLYLSPVSTLFNRCKSLGLLKGVESSILE